MLNLKIITPQKKVLVKPVDSITCQTVDGEITILPKHSPLLTLLSPGVIKVKDNNQYEYFSAGSGYVETDGKEALVLISEAYGQNELDEKKIIEAKEQARKLLGEQKSSGERAKAWAMLQRSNVDLKVIKKLKRKV
jgi:F-type H+-transporting ATPase subunit epsilon